MTTTVTETKKSIFKLIREYFDKLAEVWFLIFLFFALYFHIEMLKLFPLSPKAVHIWLASCYQIIGSGCVLFQINKSLKTLKGDDLIKSIKQYLVTWPKMTARHINIQASISNISFTSSVSGVVIKKNKSETLEEKIERLSKRIDEIDKKINANQKNLTDKFENDKEKRDKQISTIREDLRILNVNLEDTVIGDYKIAIFGILMIIYGICIPVVGLYT